MYFLHSQLLEQEIPHQMMCSLLVVLSVEKRDINKTLIKRHQRTLNTNLEKNYPPPRYIWLINDDSVHLVFKP